MRALAILATLAAGIVAFMIPSRARASIGLPSSEPSIEPIDVSQFPTLRPVPTVKAPTPPMTSGTLPLGIRQNNPGNLRDAGIAWKGMSGAANGYLVFSEPIWGLRAAARNLLTYMDRYKLRTVREIVSRWAPPNENNTAAYIRSVTHQTGFAPDQVLRSDNATLVDLLDAIVRHENGQQPYSQAMLADAVSLARQN